MNFNDHSSLRGTHAFMSPSNYHWLNYDEEKFANAYLKRQAVEQGTILHDFARQCIQLGQKLPRSTKTLNRYVNDAIGFRMVPEQILYFSENCFGSADAISFKNNLLRIHDLKTGETPASMRQLEIYAALFCLEYGYSPFDIQIELRIYQSDDLVVECPDGDLIKDICDKIITGDKVLEKIKGAE